MVKMMNGICGKEIVVKTWKTGFSLKCKDVDDVVGSKSVTIYAKADPISGISHLCGGCGVQKK